MLVGKVIIAPAGARACSQARKPLDAGSNTMASPFRGAAKRRVCVTSPRTGLCGPGGLRPWGFRPRCSTHLVRANMIQTDSPQSRRDVPMSAQGASPGSAGRLRTTSPIGASLERQQLGPPRWGFRRAVGPLPRVAPWADVAPSLRDYGIRDGDRRHTLRCVEQQVRCPRLHDSATTWRPRTASNPRHQNSFATVSTGKIAPSN